MTGKTHLFCSVAVVLTPMVALRSIVPAADSLSLSTKSVSANHLLYVALIILAGAIGGLFPDLDAPESELLHAPRKLARQAGWVTASMLGMPKISILRLLLYGLFWLPGVLLSSSVTGLSLAIRSVSHHRGLTHELRGLLLFTGLGLLLTSGLLLLWRLPTLVVLHTTLLIGAAWTLGYFTHLLLDAATISGIPLLSSRRVFHVLPSGCRIRTGTWPDTILLRAIASIWLALILVLALFA